MAPTAGSMQQESSGLPKAVAATDTTAATAPDSDSIVDDTDTAPPNVTSYSPTSKKSFPFPSTRVSASYSSQQPSKATDRTISQYPYLLPGKVAFRDCDMYFHVNNATYYHYFDNLFNTFFVEEGGMDPMYGSIIGLTAANECNYISDIKFPSRLRLALRVVSIGRTSAKIEAAVFKSKREDIKTGGFHAGDGRLDVSLAHSEGTEEWQLAAIGKYVWVFCERIPGQKMKPHPIPDDMKAALLRAQADQ